MRLSYWAPSGALSLLLASVAGHASPAGAASQPAQSASSPTSPDTLSQAPPALAAAVRQVWAASQGARSADAKLAVAEAEADAAAQPRYNPELELEAENADVERRRVGVSQTIDWSGKRAARAAAGSAALIAAQAERDQTRQLIALEWLSGYASYQVATEQVELGARRVELLDQFAALAQRRLAAGDIATLERDLAELAFQEARAQQAELLADQAKARRALLGIVGSGGMLPELPVAMPPEAVTPLGDGEIDALPTMRQGQAEIEAARARITVAERDRKPDPTLTLSGGRVSDGPVSDNLVSVTLSIPLFVRNPYRAEVVAARATVDQAEAALQDRRLRALAQVEEAATGYNALRAAWLNWIGSHASRVGERATLLQRLWEAGELSTADYLVQLKQSVDTELTANGVRARVWQAWFEWLGASGRLEHWLARPAEASTDIPREHP